MSKSLNNYIGIDENPESMFEKAMKIPDEVLIDFLKLTTDIDEEFAKNLIEEDVVNAHKVYAREIIKMYHGEEFVKQAEEKYNTIAKGGIPNNIEVLKLSSECESIQICDLLLKSNFAKSKSEAKRMINEKGVKINGETILDVNFVVKFEKENILQFGKNKFLKIE